MNRKLYSLAGYLVALFLQQTETKTYKNDASKSNFKVPLVRSNCKPTYIYFVLALHSLRRKWKKSERWGGGVNVGASPPLSVRNLFLIKIVLSVGDEFYC